MGTEEYDRGIQDQRLLGHDQHFAQINGSQAKAASDLSFLKTEMAGLRLDLQRLTDAVSSNQNIVVTTAQAVENERKSTAEAVENQRITQRDSTEKKWLPLGRMVGAVSIVSAIVGLVAWLISVKG